MSQNDFERVNIGRAAGFTLVELMIVVVIVAILSAIAYPNYRAYVERGQRSEGRALLVEVGNRMERFYSDCNIYPGNLTDTPGASNNCAGGTGGTGLLVIPSLSSENNYYTIGNPTFNIISDATVDANQQRYTLTVTPANWTDNDCGALILDSTGARSRAGGGKTIDECWGK